MSAIRRSSSSIRNQRRKSVEYYPSPISSVVSLDQYEFPELTLLRTPEPRSRSSYSPVMFPFDSTFSSCRPLPDVPESPQQSLLFPTEQLAPSSSIAADGDSIPAAMAAYDALLDATIRALHDQTLALRSSLTQLLPSHTHNLRPKVSRPQTMIDKDWQTSALARLESLVEAHHKVDAVNSRYKEEMGGKMGWLTEYDVREIPLSTQEIKLDVNGFVAGSGRSLIIKPISFFATSKQD